MMRELLPCANIYLIRRACRAVYARPALFMREMQEAGLGKGRIVAEPRDVSPLPARMMALCTRPI